MFSKLLQGPLRGRARRHVHVNNLACTDLHHDEDVEELESRRDNGQEVGGDDRLRVIANECRPALRRMVQRRGHRDLDSACTFSPCMVRLGARV